jgi:CheY-like chemotaxis protein
MTTIQPPRPSSDPHNVMKPDPATRQRPATVVVVDDDETNLTLLRRILARRPGLDVLAESDGRRGLDLIRRCNPDLVLLDLHLPTMDGETVVREIRSDPATAATPILVISGEANPQTKRRLREAGATDYLEKPLNVQALLDTIDSLLQ